MPIEKTARMDMQNFVIPFLSDDLKECRLFIPQPSANELNAIASILGFIYPKIQNQSVDFMVFVKDWEIMIERHLRNDSDKEEQLNQLKAFLGRKITDANAFYIDGTQRGKLSDDEREFCSGSLLFFSSLFRYLKAAFKDSDMTDLLTSHTALEYSELLRKSYAEQSANADKKPLRSKQ